MAALFETGRIVDIALSVLLLEFLVLTLQRLWRGAGRGPGLLSSLANLLAGASLLLALRAALVAAPWTEVALWLGAGLIAHLVDLRSRWPAKSGELDG